MHLSAKMLENFIWMRVHNRFALYIALFLFLILLLLFLGGFRGQIIPSIGVKFSFFMHAMLYKCPIGVVAVNLLFISVFNIFQKVFFNEKLVPFLNPLRKTDVILIEFPTKF